MRVRTLRSVVVVGAVILLNACSSPGGRTPNQGQVIDGQAVADRLNARYVNTVADCSGQPAFLCSGVTLRVLDPFNPNLQPLDPTPTQIGRNGASFSFIRNDLGIKQLYQTGWAGFTVDMQDPAGFVPLKARCVFPTNGSTDSRSDSCNYAKPDMTPTLKSRPCAEQGIDTAQAWGTYFNGLPDRRFSCAFDISAKGFELSMASREFISEDSQRRTQWNELVIASWTQADVPRLPVEAVFYSQVDIPPFALVQRHQCRIFFTTGRRVPLLKLDLNQTDGRVFSFNQADQIDFDNAPPECNYAPTAVAKP